MTAEDLYIEMKNALDYFGLRFNEKGQMHVEFCDGFVVFSHENREITVKATDEHDDEDPDPAPVPMCGSCGHPRGYCGQC